MGTAKHAGQAVAGEGRWPVVGPKAARGISRRVVVWAVGVARGWAAEEEWRRGAAGGGGNGVRHHPWATLGMAGSPASAQDNEEHVLSLGKSLVGPLTVQALRVYRGTLDEVGAGMAATAGGDGGEREGEACGGGGGGRRQQGQDEGRELLVQWYRLACDVVHHAMHWPCARDVGGGNLVELLALGLPHLSDADGLVEGLSCR